MDQTAELDADPSRLIEQVRTTGEISPRHHPAPSISTRRAVRRSIGPRPAALSRVAENVEKEMLKGGLRRRRRKAHESEQPSLPKVVPTGAE
jgi:hypothetical protein